MIDEARKVLFLDKNRLYQGKKALYFMLTDGNSLIFREEIVFRVDKVPVIGVFMAEVYVLDI